MSEKTLSEIWDYLEGGQTVGDIADVRRGEWNEKKNPRPNGVCRACKRFGKGALIHESPGTAKCREGCDAFEGA